MVIDKILWKTVFSIDPFYFPLGVHSNPQEHLFIDDESCDCVRKQLQETIN